MSGQARRVARRFPSGRSVVAGAHVAPAVQPNLPCRQGSEGANTLLGQYSSSRALAGWLVSALTSGEAENRGRLAQAPETAEAL